MVGPREILAEEGWRSELTWREHGELRKRGHRPSLAGRLPNGGLIPIEVDLTGKSTARLQAVLRLHAGVISARRVSAVMYVCANQDVANRVVTESAHVGLSPERGNVRVELLSSMRSAVSANDSG